MTPSLFDALASGKAQPVRNTAKSMTLENGSQIKFRGEDVVHPFTISVRVKGAAAGRLFTYMMTSGTREGKVTVDAEGHVVYTTPTDKTLTTTGTLDDNKWHIVTLTHYYAQGRTLLYLDNESAGELRERVSSIADVFIGDEEKSVTRQLSELFFWRAAITPDEVAAMVNGKLLKSSLEIYVPTESAEALDNLAMSTNTVQYVDATSSVSLPKMTKPMQTANTYDLQGRLALAGQKGILIENGRKVMR